ncbi:LysR substrate-binding domain-containing protein [Hyphococcus sp.]|uniref:LysR substrate-binding domain-containing protein n=1 Tax=Hyphococcus sp. TaxID=2038636 RepID=UPI0035C70334
MFERMPSPSALRTFEAAARLGSFRAAAEELGVTPTAVSHQVRALEKALGIALFARRARAVALTQSGDILAVAVGGGLLQIKQALERIAAAQATLTVTTTPAFAALRLAPHLPAFYARHPEISVQLLTGAEPVDLRRERQVDIAIRYGGGPYPELHAVPLLGETFGAYGAPGLVETFCSLKDAPLLATRWRRPVLKHVAWKQWLVAAGEEAPAPDLRVVTFDEEYYALQAAVAGQGLVLASSALAGDMVARGLLAPYRPEIQLQGAEYVALCLPERFEAKRVRDFMRWLEAHLKKAD